MKINLDDLFVVSPMSLAIAEGDIATVKTLLTEGANVNERSKIGGSTPLHEAISRSAVAMGKIKEELAEWKPEPSEPATNPFDLFAKFDMRGMARQRFLTPTPFVEPRPDYLDMVRLLLEAGADIHAETETLRTTPLHTAAEGGQTETVRLLLDWGAETHRQDSNGQNALMAAAEAQRLDVVRLLLKCGADPEQRTAQGATSLMAAARGGNIEIAELLLERGVGINVMTQGGNTALLCAIMGYRDAMRDFLISRGAEVGIFEAAVLGDYEQARSLPLPELRTSHWGQTPIGWAIRTDNKELLRFVLSLGIRFDIQDEATQELSKTAALLGDAETMKMLMDAGLLAQSVPSVSLHSETPLPKFSSFDTAITMNDVSMAKLLIEQGANVDGEDNTNDYAMSPLLTAVTRGSAEMATMLLDMGANPNGASRDIMPPLAIAMQKDDEAMVKLLLERGANPKQKTGQASTLTLAHNSRFLPMLNAAVPDDIFELAKGGKTEALIAALDAGTDIHSTDEHERTALHLAVRAGHTEMVRELLDRGADVNRYSGVGLTPLMEAVIGGEHSDIVEMLLDRGANLHAESDRGDTALRFALYNKRSKIVSRLIEAGAKIGMIEAAFMGEFETLRYFLREGKDVDDSNNGVTALMMAARGGHNECVLFLLEHGANINAVDKSGVTALHHAATHRNFDTVNLLLDRGAAIDAFGADEWMRASMNKRMAQREDEGVKEFFRDIETHWRGSTPLEFACFLPETDMVLLLLARGANVNGGETPADKSPLRMAVLGKRTETVRLLLDRGADVHHKDYNGETVLSQTRYTDTPVEIVELLKAAQQANSPR